jgi:hypothetical protein
MTDYYTAIFLNSENGNRYVIENCQAEIVPTSELQTYETGVMSTYIVPKKKQTMIQRLDIVLTMEPPEKETLDKFKLDLLGQMVYLHFKDVHPALIRGHIKAVTLDHLASTVRFVGNTTDKTYQDYIVEVSNQLQAYQYHWQASTALPNESETIEEKGRKVKVLKRKLTFK